jgi:predicted CxxxxCH...CXXCH cytochrome family protein
MARVASWGAAVAAAVALAGCGDARTVQLEPLGAESNCASCHTAPGEPPPFRDQTGSTSISRVTVGAHDAHLHGTLAVIDCGACHTVPRTISDPGHLDDSPNDIKFGAVATTGGANPSYVAFGCAATYCHGNFPGGNRGNAPNWLGGDAAAQCGSCHGIPPPSGRHPEHASAGVRCDQCHGTFLTETHVNGVVNVTLSNFDAKNLTCTQACHDPRSWPAPGDAGR